MRRIISSAMAALLLVGPQLAAQQDEEPGQVYVAYHKVSFADMQEWIGIYYEHTVPVLEALQEEGVIQGWNVWQHSTGGEYNWRFGIRATDWSQYSRFWSEFLSRLQEGSPEAFSRSLAMIQAHHDEIWDIDEVHVPDPAPAFQYIYDSQFQISFADIEEWNRAWNETAAPILNGAMEDGILGGWVREGHNTGGRYNWKVLYLFEEWDHIDDLFERLVSQLMADAELWQKLGRMVAAHDDIIWTSVPEPGM